MSNPSDKKPRHTLRGLDIRGIRLKIVGRFNSKTPLVVKYLEASDRIDTLMTPHLATMLVTGIAVLTKAAAAEAGRKVATEEATEGLEALLGESARSESKRMAA
jgi:hypothetical protein